jgi:hypothetical protein
MVTQQKEDCCALELEIFWPNRAEKSEGLVI